MIYLMNGFSFRGLIESTETHLIAVSKIESIYKAAHTNMASTSILEEIFAETVFSSQMGELSKDECILEKNDKPVSFYSFYNPELAGDNPVRDCGHGRYIALNIRKDARYRW